MINIFSITFTQLLVFTFNFYAGILKLTTRRFTQILILIMIARSNLFKLLALLIVPEAKCINSTNH